MKQEKCIRTSVDSLKANVLQMLKAYFPEQTFDLENLRVLHDEGHFANALVLRYQDDVCDFVIKDFTRCNWFIRNTFARFIVDHEASVLERLHDIPGITNGCYRLSPCAVAYPFIVGTPLNDIKKQGRRLPRQFFTDFEKLVARIHQRGLVHLDLRNLGNVLVDENGKPCCIDFQSSIGYRHFPRGLQRFMKGADITGIYKAWDLLCDEPMGTVRKGFFESFNILRKRWIFKGYPVARLKRRVRRWFMSL